MRLGSDFGPAHMQRPWKFRFCEPSRAFPAGSYWFWEPSRRFLNRFFIFLSFSISVSFFFSFFFFVFQVYVFFFKKMFALLQKCSEFENSSCFQILFINSKTVCIFQKLFGFFKKNCVLTKLLGMFLFTLLTTFEKSLGFQKMFQFQKLFAILKKVRYIQYFVRF